MKHLIATLFIVAALIHPCGGAIPTYNIVGKVLSESSREAIPYVAITLEDDPSCGAVSDEQGNFTISGAEAGFHRLVAQSLGYQMTFSDQFQLTAATPPITISMAAGGEQLDSIVVSRSLFRRVVESPVSMRRIGVQQIEKSPGANRDISRVVQSYPGVAFSPAAYRNDLIVRGGSPSENSFFMDGIEIPNINHFSTQGASGGPVGLINADLIRELDFYSSAYPADLTGGMSSIMDIELLDGSPDKRSYKATLGASEVAISGDGYLGEKCDYIFSLRQSYLQLLFKALGLPFLPNYIDGLIKFNYNISKKDKLTFLALVGIDDMSLNEEGTTTTSEYILGYLPRIEQQSYTVGTSYRHYGDGHSERLSLSYSFLNNENIKYYNNDESSPDNLWYNIATSDGELTLRSDNRLYRDLWSYRYGAELSYGHYGSNYLRRTYIEGEDYSTIAYDNALDIYGYGLYFGGAYSSRSGRLSLSLGGRMDGNSYSSSSRELWRQFSPRLSASYILPHDISISAGAGIYYQMPTSTALLYEVDGVRVNSSLGYSNVKQLTLGSEWRPSHETLISIEGFYKGYGNMPVSIESGVPLADVGDDYGIVGDEALTQSGIGRAYGVELMAQWQIRSRLSIVGSLTIFKSEYASERGAEYIPSAWDNGYIFNGTASYNLPRGWSIGAKLSSIGGAPYTPYDLDSSSLVVNWDSSGQPQLDYSQYNSERLSSYTQLDLRVDKLFYFDKWMLGLYLDIQNITASQYVQADLWISTGEIIDSSLPLSEQRYILSPLENSSGTMLPTFGVTARF